MILHNRNYVLYSTYRTATPDMCIITSGARTSICMYLTACKYYTYLYIHNTTHRAVAASHIDWMMGVKSYLQAQNIRAGSTDRHSLHLRSTSEEQCLILHSG